LALSAVGLQRGEISGWSAFATTVYIAYVIVLFTPYLRSRGLAIFVFNDVEKR
jgi:hypothetical protein